MKKILNGIINENPTFVLLLGLCPALAVTTKFENAYIMGLCVLMILVFSSFIISLLKKFIVESVRIPVCILIIGTFVTITEMLLAAYAPELSRSLGIYLPLVVVNCIVLGRCLSVSLKESVKTSIIDAISIGFGFTLSLMIIAIIREVLGTGVITIMDSTSAITGFKAVYQIIPNLEFLPIPLLVAPAGAFLTLGILLGIIPRKEKNHESI